MTDTTIPLEEREDTETLKTAKDLRGIACAKEHQSRVKLPDYTLTLIRARCAEIHLPPPGEPSTAS